MFLQTERKMGNLTLRGASIAARSTGLFIPELCLGLDAGNPGLRQLSFSSIFITHVHCDHTSDLPNILLNIPNEKGRQKLKIFCPKSSVEAIRNYIDAFFRMSKGLEASQVPKIHNKYDIIGVEVGSEVPFKFDPKEQEKHRLEKKERKEEKKLLKHKKKMENKKNERKDILAKGPFIISKDIPTKHPFGTVIEKKMKSPTWVVEILPCCHTAPDTIGFGVSQVRQKLLPQYHGLPQDELNRLSKGDGENPPVNLNHAVKFPMFCFMGDTNEQAFYVPDPENPTKVIFSPTLEKYKYIIIECTFLDKEDLVHAIKDRHMHWSKLEPYIRAHPETTFILIHFSARYSVEYITKFFNDIDLPNVDPFLPPLKYSHPSVKMRPKSATSGISAVSHIGDSCCTDSMGELKVSRPLSLISPAKPIEEKLHVEDDNLSKRNEIKRDPRYPHKKHFPAKKYTSRPPSYLGSFSPARDDSKSSVYFDHAPISSYPPLPKWGPSNRSLTIGRSPSRSPNTDNDSPLSATGIGTRLF